MLPFKNYKGPVNENATREHRGQMTAAMFKKLSDTPTFTSVSAPLVIASNVLGLQGWGPDPAHGATFYGLRYPGLAAAGDYGVLVQDNGATFVNAATGQIVSLRNNNVETAYVNAAELGIPTGKQLKAGGSLQTYGALTIDGMKNTWSGINFRNAGANVATLMVQAGSQGFYNAADNNWLWYWNNGTLVIGTVPVANVSGLANSATITAQPGNVANSLVYRDGNGDINVGRIVGDARTQGSAHLLYDDVSTYRTANSNTGVVYLNASQNRYLFFNGTSYELPNSSLIVNGTNYPSSRDYKTNIRDIPAGAIGRLRQLRPRLFRYKTDETGRTQAGFIFEEATVVLPDLAIPNEQPGANGEPPTKGLDYNSIFTTNVKATQELIEEVIALRQRVQSLEDRLTAAGIP